MHTKNDLLFYTISVIPRHLNINTDYLPLSWKPGNFELVAVELFIELSRFTYEPESALWN